MSLAPRFVQVGRARVQVLEAVAHDPDGARAVVRTLDALRPRLLLLDRSRDDWDGVRAGRLDPYNERLLAAVQAAGRASPDVLWREAKAWAARTGARVGVIHPTGTPPPGGRRGLRALDRLLRREGFEAAGPVAAARRFVDLYVHRVPAVRDWLMQRRDETARRLWESLSGQDVSVVVVLAAPDADPVCDRLAEARQGPRPS